MRETGAMGEPGAGGGRSEAEHKNSSSACSPAASFMENRRHSLRKKLDADGFGESVSMSVLTSLDPKTKLQICQGVSHYNLSWQD